jgi:hypothetical protein
LRGIEVSTKAVPVFRNHKCIVMRIHDFTGGDSAIPDCEFHLLRTSSAMELKATSVKYPGLGIEAVRCAIAGLVSGSRLLDCFP